MCLETGEQAMCSRSIGGQSKLSRMRGHIKVLLRVYGSIGDVVKSGARRN